MTDPDAPSTAALPVTGRAAVVVSVLGGVVVIVLGFVLGVAGVVLTPARPSVLGVGIPLAWGLAGVNFVAGRLAQAALNSTRAALLPLAGWLLAVGPCWLFTPGGDSLVLYDDAALIFVAAAVMASLLALGVPPRDYTRAPSTPMTPADQSDR